MEPNDLYVLAYFILLSIVGFILIKRDKQYAKRRARRTPENTLMFVAFAGGALGTWVAMYMFRHKTKHTAFVIGVPLLLAWNVLAYLWLTDRLPL